MPPRTSHFGASLVEVPRPLTRRPRCSFLAVPFVPRHKRCSCTSRGLLRYPDLDVTPRDDSLLATLTLKVRVLSLPMVARTWWDDTAAGHAAAERRLGELVDTGWLRRHAATSHPELLLTEPVFAWDVGDRRPHFGGLSHRLKSRWTSASEQVLVYFATTKATRVHGGTAAALKPMSLTHDLHMGALYLRFLATRPDDARLWVSEDTLAPERDGQTLPDAVLTDAAGRLRQVVEFGGTYPAERLMRLHDDCEARELPYELW